MGQPILAVVFLFSRTLGTDHGLRLNEQLSRFLRAPQRTPRLCVIHFSPPGTSHGLRVSKHYSPSSPNYSLSTTNISFAPRRVSGRLPTRYLGGLK